MLNFYSKELIAKKGIKGFIKTAAEAVEIMATENAEKFGYGRSVVLSHGGFWVISKVRFNILSNSLPDNKVIAQTWPLPPGRIKVERQYRIKNSSGEILLNAASEWCVLSIDTRRPIRMEQDVFSGGHKYLTEKSGAGDFTRIRFKLDEDDFNYSRVITKDDIDLNNHTNNKKYTDMVLDLFDEEFLINNPIKSYELHFLKETYLGDTINIYKKSLDSNALISGVCNGNTVFNAVVEF